MKKQLIFYIVTAFCIAVCSSFYMGLKTGIKQTRAELISAQAITLKAQLSEIEILKEKRALKVKKVKQTVEDVANKAHADLVEIEMGEGNNEKTQNKMDE